ncbi:MAG: RrF2 family transcriptional regulator [Paracoccus sp. (in: a-proteobacteria)]
MQLSMFTDYALRVLLHLAASPDQLLSTRQIAEIHSARYNHLSKVTAWLVNEGYARASRGRGGGLRLARAPSEINMGKVVRALEADKPLVECMRPDGGACRLSPACGLASALDMAQSAFYDVLDRYTLADLTRLAPGMRNLLAAMKPEVQAI